MPARSADPGTAAAASGKPVAVKRSPRERLLEAAHELFYAEGVQTVGVDRIIDRAGVAKASLYSTFGSKEELVHAYLDDRHARVLANRRRAVEAAGEDPVERLLAVFDSQAAGFLAPDYNGCPFIRARAEAAADSRISEASDAYRHDIHALLRDLSEAAGARDPDALARQLQMLYDGAAAAANQDRDPRIATAQRAAAEALIRAALEG